MPRDGGRRGGGERGAASGLRPLQGGSYTMTSPQLGSSPLLRGHRAAVPRREALILQIVLNHPWLAHDHLEELADLEFRHADTQKLKGVLLDLLAHDGEVDSDRLKEGVAGQGHAGLLDRMSGAITIPSVWGARSGAAPDDVLLTWKQLIALHQQWQSLIKELRDAEQALGRDTTDANYSWLCDVKVRLSAVDGTEAQVDGFGAASGRKVSNL